MYWSQYRRTFLPTQAVILIVCLLFFFIGHLTPRGLVAPLVVMEAAAVFGARQAARMKMALRAGEPLPRPLTND